MMDPLDPPTPSHPSLLHRLSSSSTSSSSSRPTHVVGAQDDGGPTRFRRTSSSSNSVLRLDKEEIREREMLVNEYEAEEERLVNVLGRRMEELRSENTTLHNTMEGESEAVVNKLQR
ncbi:hypothetical protein BDY24DRAFT_383677 [Mrakia frigida]|uniref:Rts3p n=1 Tax=Mrakia frigida TaxID=29902 RepID=UPI003FCBF725